jgi:hypothetical protein
MLKVDFVLGRSRHTRREPSGLAGYNDRAANRLETPLPAFVWV